MSRAVALAFPLLALALPAVAQSAPSAAVRRAAATITAADYQRRIDIIAHDSMQGRDTPSRGLDLTAQYLADEFRRLGLRPGGEQGGYLQRYPITKKQLDLGASSLTLAAGGRSAVARFDAGARFAQGAVPAAPIEAGVVLLAGPVAPEALTPDLLRGKAVLVALAAPGAPGGVMQSLRAIAAAGPSLLVLLQPVDSAAYAQRLPRTAPTRVAVDMGPTRPRPVIVDAWSGAFEPVLAAAGTDLAALRAAGTPVARALDGVTLRADLRDRVLERVTAPNAIGIVEGTDPALRKEYVVYSAHMDHVGMAGAGSGCTARGADSICNGADDDASGTVGLVELAEAFMQPGARPKRSIVLLGVSGEEKGLWGSQYFSEHPTVPLADVVANVNMDMIGRNWPDTIVAIGKEHSDLGATLATVNARHPELRMTAIDDKWPEERFYFRSDHYNFARKGVPILFFFNGVHDDYHQVGDHPDKIDSEKASRIVKLLYFLGQELANARTRPQWNPESYRQIVEVAGTP